MQQGSLVVIKKAIFPSPSEFPEIKWLPIADESTIYTIRAIEKQDRLGVLFEEGIIGFQNGHEIGVTIDYVIEIQPPMNIEEIIEESIYVLV